MEISPEVAPKIRVEDSTRCADTPAWSGRAALGLYVLGFLVRVAGLPHRSLWIDEFVSIEWARAPLASIPAIAIPAHSPPLYFLILGIALRLGPPIAAARAVSLLIAMALLVVVHRIGRALLGVKGALVVLLLAAASPFLAEVTMEIRTYGLLALGGAVAVWGLLRWRDGASPTLSIAGVLVAAYTQHLGLFSVGVVDGAWLALGEWSSERRRSWIAGQVVLLVLLAPAIYWPLANYGHFPFVEYTFMQAVKRYAGIPIHWTEGYLVSQVSVADLIARAGDPSLLVALAVGFGVPLWVAWRSLDREALAAPVVRVGFVWVLVPILLASILKGSREYLSARYAVMAAPGYYLLLARALSLRRARWESIVAIALGMTLAVSVVDLARSPTHTHYPEDWRGLALYLFAPSQTPGALVTTARGAAGLALYEDTPARVALVVPPYPAALPVGRTWVLIGNRQLPRIGGIALRPDVLDAQNLGLLDRAMALAWGRRRRGQPRPFGKALWLVDYSP